MNGAETGKEQVQLGNKVVEFEPEQAQAVREAFQNLATSYGQAVDLERRRLLEQIGTPGWQPPQPAEAPFVHVPDADLLLTNKDAWEQNLNVAIEGRIRQAQGEQAALLQGALGAVDQEFKRREHKAQAQELHDGVMEEMLERRKLGDNRRMVQAIYNEQYGNLQHLPLTIAIDQIGQLAEEEIASIRGNSPASPAAAQTTPPAMLRSSRRAAGDNAPLAHGQKTLSDLIRRRQAFLMGRDEAA